MNEVHDLLKAKIQCIWIDTYEEHEAIKDLKVIANKIPGMNLYLWSHTEGLKKLALTSLERQEPADPKLMQPNALFNHIRDMQENENKTEGIYILRDLHLLNDNHAVKRALRDIKEYPAKNFNPIIVIAPVVNIPPEWEKLFTIISYDLPSKEEIENIVSHMAAGINKAIERGKNFKAPTEEDQRQIVKACIGLTHNEIANVFAKSLVQYKELSLDAVLDEKIQLVKKSGVLDYSVPKYSFDDIGGNKAFKDWVEEIEESFSEEAMEFGCQVPKGYLALGIPGASKTVSAEAIAHKFGVPFLKLDMSRIMSKLVGESERKIDQALRVAKAIAPCVLLIDEVEKALGGVNSSNSSDSGTLARVFGKLLQFLNEPSGVFTVMTSNDVSQLPPELTRSGRLDAIWYFGLPDEEERREIFRIHLGKTGKEVTDELINVAAKHSDTFTGAEIAEVVKVALRKAFKRYKQDGVNAILEEDIVAACKEVIPLYKSSKERILALEAWANGRARQSNYSDNYEEDNSFSDDELLDVLQLER